MRSALGASRRRLRAALWPVAQTSVAAALAWYIAHDALGHAQPFFAPIAAAISMSASNIQRGRRAIQMVFGVTLGIGVGEAAAAVIGTGAVAIGVVVFVAMCIALAVAQGFVGQGLMFVNQTAASAILVIALHRTGTGSERLVDAFIGGGIALLASWLLFPAAPLPLVRRAAVDVLAELRDALHRVATARSPLGVDWTLATGQRIHTQVIALSGARATASAIARVAPRWWSARSAVRVWESRVGRITLLANGVLSLVRGAAVALDAGEPVPQPLSRAIEALASALARLARDPEHGSPEAAEHAHRAAQLSRQVPPDDTAGVAMIATVVRTCARDVLLVLGADAESAAEAAALVRERGAQVGAGRAG